jgi:hypothetical protein
VLECWSVGVLEYWSIGVVEWWSGGVLECWSVGVLECWSIGVLEWWSGGVVECWIVVSAVVLETPGVCPFLALHFGTSTCLLVDGIGFFLRLTAFHIKTLYFVMRQSRWPSHQVRQHW